MVAAIAKYVGSQLPDNFNRALLLETSETPVFKTPAEWLGTFPAVYVFGPDIVPNTNYRVRVDYGSVGCPLLSESTTLATSKWGDVAGPFDAGAGSWSAPDGAVTVPFDELAILDAFGGLYTKMPFHRADLDTFDCDIGEAGTRIDILDVVAVIDAFRGTPYEQDYPNCPDPCAPASPPGPSNPYYFTGRRLDFHLTDATSGDDEFVLYHYRARAYDALNGRFLQRDPLGYTDGMNVYEYVRSRPGYLIDPDGRIPGELGPAYGIAEARLLLEVKNNIRTALDEWLNGFSDKQWSALAKLPTAVARAEHELSRVGVLFGSVARLKLRREHASAAYDPLTNNLLVGDHLDPQTLMHELIHAMQDEDAGGTKGGSDARDEGESWAFENQIQLAHVFTLLEDELDNFSDCEAIKLRWSSAWSRGDGIPKIIGFRTNRGVVNAVDVRNLRQRSGFGLRCSVLAGAYNKKIAARGLDQPPCCLRLECSPPSRRAKGIPGPDHVLNAVWK